MAKKSKKRKSSFLSSFLKGIQKKIKKKKPVPETKKEKPEPEKIKKLGKEEKKEPLIKKMKPEPKRLLLSVPEMAVEKVKEPSKEIEGFLPFERLEIRKKKPKILTKIDKGLQIIKKILTEKAIEKYEKKYGGFEGTEEITREFKELKKKAVKKPKKERVQIDVEAIKKSIEEKRKGKEKEKEIKEAKELIADVKEEVKEIEKAKEEEKPIIDIAAIKKAIEERKRGKGIEKKEIKEVSDEYIPTGIPGFDELITKGGFRKSKSILVSGGPGTGKTLFCSQLIYNAALKGKKCLYVSFEEAPKGLMEHMREFGWHIDKLEKQKKIIIHRQDPFMIARGVEALLEKAAGSLTINIKSIPLLIPKGFKPDIIAIDSISALASAFTGKAESYRIYIEQLFRFFEKLGVTVFLITETQEAPKKFSESGVEEFLADGVVVLYYIKIGDRRVRALEIIKLRGLEHEKRIIPFRITNTGLIVFPEERVYLLEEAMGKGA